MRFIKYDMHLGRFSVKFKIFIDQSETSQIFWNLSYK